MDIDSLTLDDLHNIVEGLFCFPISGEPSRERMQALALDLQEYHELREDEIVEGLEYYRDGVGNRPELDYDWQHRMNFFDYDLGYEGI